MGRPPLGPRAMTQSERVAKLMRKRREQLAVALEALTRVKEEAASLAEAQKIVTDALEAMQ